MPDDIYLRMSLPKAVDDPHARHSRSPLVRGAWQVELLLALADDPLAIRPPGAAPARPVRLTGPVTFPSILFARRL